jgi:hypothetical protein
MLLRFLSFAKNENPLEYERYTERAM